jgi:hypothetical protein
MYNSNVKNFLLQVLFNITVTSIAALTGVRRAAKPSVVDGTWKDTSTRASTDVQQTGKLTHYNYVH